MSGGLEALIILIPVPISLQIIFGSDQGYFRSSHMLGLNKSYFITKTILLDPK